MIDERLASFALDPGFWRAAVPMLTVEGAPPVVRAPSAEAIARAHETIAKDGFLELPDAASGDVLDRVRAGLERIVAQGWPAPFVFLFEEPWHLLEGMRPLLASFLGPDYVRLAGFWAWRLAPDATSHGWGPHRDALTRSIRPDGTLDIMTLWFAVTDATPANGCMYFLPAPHDPNYIGDLTLADVPDLAAVRALPARAGTVLGWTQQLLHWGGRSTAWAEGPRVSFSMEFQRRDVPLRNQVVDVAVPPFRDRARMLGFQIRRYAHMEPPGEALSALATHLIES